MTAWESAVARLDAVSLEELQERAELLTRVDRKYLVPEAEWAHIVESLDDAPLALDIQGEREFGYRSMYLDTADLESYRAAAHRRPSRYKVRARTYLDTGGTAIEVKLRGRRGETVKRRHFVDSPCGRDGRLQGEAREFVAGFGIDADRLVPTLETRYRRSTLLTRDGRLTVDRSVRGIDPAGAAVSYGDDLVIETKGGQRPGAIDRALWAAGHRPTRISKYCTSLAALRPELPANRWNRTLRRHLVPTASPVAASL
ncbi:polyphosphate polymerase domain-containing protein [Demequina pelophila]|uniref:polyphosphate polymerase domain-containing protein n=1 Tax=Demequina pelophila TaxID=1638984 RepID=UPI0007861FFC|nr:polyphosphate polymerase domain-containing protein [Demequina pelophila]